MKTHQKHLSTLFAIAALLGGTSQGFAATIAPSLGTASNFVVLGGAGVTCTASAVSGDVGSLVTVTGFPTPAPALCTLVVTVHSVDAAATTAFADFAVADDAPAGMPCAVALNLTGQALAGKALALGAHCSPAPPGIQPAGILT